MKRLMLAVLGAAFCVIGVHARELTITQGLDDDLRITVVLDDGATVQDIKVDAMAQWAMQKGHQKNALKSTIVLLNTIEPGQIGLRLKDSAEYLKDEVAVKDIPADELKLVLFPNSPLSFVGSDFLNNFLEQETPQAHDVRLGKLVVALREIKDLDVNFNLLPQYPAVLTGEQKKVLKKKIDDGMQEVVKRVLSYEYKEFDYEALLHLIKIVKLLSWSWSQEYTYGISQEDIARVAATLVSAKTSYQKRLQLLSPAQMNEHKQAARKLHRRVTEMTRESIYLPDSDPLEFYCAQLYEDLFIPEDSAKRSKQDSEFMDKLTLMGKKMGARDPLDMVTGGHKKLIGFVILAAIATYMLKNVSFATRVKRGLKRLWYRARGKKMPVRIPTDRKADQLMALRALEKGS